VCAAETGEDVLDFVEAGLGGTVLDEYLAHISMADWGEEACLRVAGLEGQHLGRAGNGMRRSQHLQGDASRKQQSPGLYRKFGLQQWHLAW
jgi:hypothetical protein